MDNWEKPSFFLNLKKRNLTNTNIPSLTTKDNKMVTDSKKILKTHFFYQDLYSSKSTIPLENSKYSEPKNLSEERKVDLDKQ